MRGRLAGRVHLPQPQWWAAQGAPLARRDGRRQRAGPLCTLATAPRHGIRQAVAVELIEKAVNPRVAVTARVEARRRGDLELAAALLCIELRLRLGGKLLRLRGRGGSRRSLEVAGGRGRSREGRGGCRTTGCARWAHLVRIDGDGRAVDVRGAKLPRPHERSVLDHHQLGHSVGDEHRLRWRGGMGGWPTKAPHSLFGVRGAPSVRPELPGAKCIGVLTY